MRHERQAPWVLFGVFAPEDGDALVDADGDLGVAAGAEDGGGAGVRVDEQDLLGRHREAALWEVPHVAGAEGEGRQVHARRAAADGEQAEADRVVDGAAEQERFVLEVQERDELGVTDQVAEERGGGGVGGDAGGQDQAAASTRADDGAGGFGEDGVGVDVAAACQRDSGRIRGGGSSSLRPCGVRPGTRCRAPGRCRGGRRLASCGPPRSAALAISGSSRGEELLLLELDPLPRGVADDAGEAAGPAGLRVDVR